VAGEKSPDAFKTIGELSEELGIAQHILRYWESRFPQLKPLQRAGNRRYYRPADVDLVKRIHRLLNQEGYTVRGVQQLLKANGRGEQPAAPSQPQPTINTAPAAAPSVDLRRLVELRDRLASALDS